MQKYDFIEEELKSLIRKIKKVDYKSARYFEDHLVIDGKTGDIAFTGDKSFLNSILVKSVVKEAGSLKAR